ncbi:MAG TPA: penicillin-binding protein 1A [Usitatibacteraceae bacterium]|nr:penicillin-binding protein 1A [Usitatibacteraceae bacterium]
MVSRWWIYPVILLGSLALVAFAIVALTIVLVYPNLPSIEAVTEYRPKLPLRVLTVEGDLLGEFGEEKRFFVKVSDIPDVMKQAVIAAEDERFYRHGGVDFIGLARAASGILTHGKMQGGASTITQQVARNFFLTNEVTLTRKVSEWLLAYKIEHNLRKDQILEIYLNHIFLGNRAHGFAAASRVYFGKNLDQLGVAEAAMLAGIPKAPSQYNPFNNLKRATLRQHYVLRRMGELGFLTPEAQQAAKAQVLQFNRDRVMYPVSGEHIAEMVREDLYKQYGERAYVSGIRVFTTIRREEQEAAVRSLRRGVLEYDRRHGYRGPEGFVALPTSREEAEEAADEALQEREILADQMPAVVLSADSKQLMAYTKRGDTVTLSGDALKFAARALAERQSPAKPVRGSIVRLIKDDKGNWLIAQLPKVEAAIVAVDPNDGAIRALVGGFEFASNKFNHVTQAMRQPGSSFKPFVYSAALEKGFTPATIVNDAPVVFDPGRNGGQVWEPKNYDGKYEGPMTVRTALAKSKNMVSIRILQAITPNYAQDYITRFGFDPKLHPPYLTLALGAGATSPLEMAGAYSVFANGGYRVKPYFIQRITDDKGQALFEAEPVTVNAASDGPKRAEQVIDPRNAFIMTSLMRDVVRSGTAAAAMSLGRGDLAGKTGTTNDHFDAWFAGYNSQLVAVSWIGFDNPADLGNNETGGRAALPIWMGFMSTALKGKPESPFEPPPGIVVLPLSSDTAKDGMTRMEFVYAESAGNVRDGPLALREANRPSEEIKNQIF